MKIWVSIFSILYDMSQQTGTKNEVPIMSGTFYTSKPWENYRTGLTRSGAFLNSLYAECNLSLETNAYNEHAYFTSTN